jgi:apolipoprotein N-acyltransferase
VLPHSARKLFYKATGPLLVALWIGIGALVAATAWIPLKLPAQLGMLWFLVLAWLVAPSRLAAFALLMAYYVVTGRGVPMVIHRFTELATAPAVSITLLYSAAIAALWALAWWPSPRQRLVGSLLVLVITTLPPLGGFIYGSPLLAAGWLFPGTGLWGILMLVASWITALCWFYESKPKYKTAAATVFGVLVLVSVVTNVNWRAPEADFIYPVHTHLPRYPVLLTEQYKRQLELTQTAMEALKQPLPVVVMPEDIAGTWQARYAWLWEEVNQAYLTEQKTLIVGFDTKPEQYANTAMVFGKKLPMQKDIYARIPAPIGGWKPWSDVHAPARWTETGKADIQSHPVAVFFCWEELVPWPWLITELHRPGQPQNAIIMVNHWFTQGLDIGDAQARSSQAWTRLFGWSHSRVVNGPVDK